MTGGAVSGTLMQIIRGVILEEGRRSRERRALVAEVPAVALEEVLRDGLLSAKRLLSHPELLKIIRPDPKERRRWIAGTRKDVRAGEPFVRGPNAYIHPPPRGLRLSPQHPSRRRRLARVEIDLDSLLRAEPKTRILGMELVPFPVSEETWERMSGREREEMRRDLGDSRMRIISLEELDELLSRSPEELWSHYDAESPLYAGDVPHVAVLTPDGRIGPEHLRAV
jgi:hypothetical protein